MHVCVSVSTTSVKLMNILCFCELSNMIKHVGGCQMAEIVWMCVSGRLVFGCNQSRSVHSDEGCVFSEAFGINTVQQIALENKTFNPASGMIPSIFNAVQQTVHACMLFSMPTIKAPL